MTNEKPGFAFLLEDQFAMLAFTSAVEVLRLANKLSGEIAFPYWFCTIDGQRVHASNGVALEPNRALDTLTRRDKIVMVSGDGVCTAKNPPIASYLRKAVRHGHHVWGISSGVVRLAEAGLLNNSEISAHWEDIPYIEENYADIIVSSSLFHLGETVASCAGGIAAADLMLSYINQTGPQGLVENISARLIMDRVRQGRVVQKLPTKLRYRSSHPKVQLALELMEASISKPLPISDIADKIAISQRQLERLFMKEFDQSPNNLYIEIRLERARYDLLATNRRIIDIASDSGFTAPRFSTIYKDAFGILPNEERKRQKTP
jgi:transcriptional regulator GlxA family with amidase domain